MTNRLPLAPRHPAHPRSLEVAGAQIESVDEALIPQVLDHLQAAYPNANLLVLPEYTLSAEPTPEIRTWCRERNRHLVVGGRDMLPGNHFRNTAWVVGPEGTVVFGQVKSVPIQFFSDGLPAQSQTLWYSPWGPIGIAICYDLSYTRVIDRLVRLGAEALVIPTMDAVSWGSQQHALHARVAPARAAEYKIPIVRCASSGISQIVDRDGVVRATAPFGDNVRFFGGTITLAGGGSRPVDRWLAPAATIATGAALLLLGIGWSKASRSRQAGHGRPPINPNP